MTEVYLMSVTGAVGGVIGSVMGLGSAWLAHQAHRRSLELKALDLRLEVRKAINTLGYGIKKLEDLLNLAFKSRSRIAVATGRHKSGEMVNWVAQFEVDTADMTDLKHAVEVLWPGFADRGLPDLEALLADLDAQAHHVKALISRYRNSLIEDDLVWAQAREKKITALNAGLSTPSA